MVGLLGAGLTRKGVRFIVLERLDGGTLTQALGYDTRIRDRRRRFWRKKQFPYLDVLRIARSLASALHYCHKEAVPGSMVLHRDLKPDNIGTWRSKMAGWLLLTGFSSGVELTKPLSTLSLMLRLFIGRIGKTHRFWTG